MRCSGVRRPGRLCKGPEYPGRLKCARTERLPPRDPHRSLGPNSLAQVNPRCPTRPRLRLFASVGPTSRQRQCSPNSAKIGGIDRKHANQNEAYVASMWSPSPPQKWANGNGARSEKGVQEMGNGRNNVTKRFCVQEPLPMCGSLRGDTRECMWILDCVKLCHALSRYITPCHTILCYHLIACYRVL